MAESVKHQRHVRQKWLIGINGVAATANVAASSSGAWRGMAQRHQRS
jgi:hypothetical protein